MCSVTIKDKPTSLLHVLMNHIIGVVDFNPPHELTKYKIYKYSFGLFLEHLQMTVDDRGSFTTEHMIFQHSGEFTMSLLGSGIFDGRLKTLSVHITCDTDTTELSGYINRNINILQKVLIRQKTASSRIMLRLMRECNCNFKYRFIKKSMTLMLNVNEKKYPHIITCNDHENCINVWKDIFDLVGVVSQKNSPDVYYRSDDDSEIITITSLKKIRPVDRVPLKSIIKDTQTSSHNVNFKQLDLNLRALPKELQERIVSFLPFNVRFKIAKYLKMTEVNKVLHNDVTCTLSRWYNVLDFFQHGTKYGKQNTVACNIDGELIQHLPNTWLHIFYDCDIVHIQHNWHLPDEWFTQECAKDRNMKLRHLSTSYDVATGSLFDSKILDGHLETLVLRLDSGYDTSPLIRFLNRKNSIKRSILLIDNHLCNVIYTILKKSNLKFDYQMSLQKTPAVLRFNANRVNKYDKNILGEILNIKLDGVWCNCIFSVIDMD
ncbi:unnamed protein product [Macrosiphum euphorbiae]|uniref:F-box domain-containing protein n=1 Tax=Macrosiphum euphorbiae TaxID=13131 RepID=A0AAV0WF49_9HEMI|nr:unnamed protein product [Macrosiphum euphorbiae]